MLVREEKMTEGDGLLLAHPAAGLGYQLAGAFKRLGRRTLVLISSPEDSIALKALPVKEISATAGRPILSPGEVSAVFFTPHPHLGLNRGLSAPELDQAEALLRGALESNPELHLIMALPKSLSADSIRRLAQLTPKHTIFLCPAIFGFRDGGLFDEARYQLETQPGTLLKTITDAPTTELAYAGDVAGFVVTAPHQERLFGKILEVPPTSRSLEEWREHFVKHFKPKISWLEKVAAKISGEGPLARFRATHSNTASSIEAEKALDLLPSVVTHLDRALGTLADLHRRQPELELVFPPGRAL